MKFMKRLFVIVLVLFLGGGSLTWASTVEESASFMKNPELNLKIDLGDISGKTDTDLEQEIAHYFESMIPIDVADLQCKVTVSGEISVGSMSFKIEVEVSGDCATIARNGRSIATMVLNEVKSEIKKIF